MRILIVHASTRGATAELARALGKSLSGRGHELTVSTAAEAAEPTGYDGVVIGSALYRGKWLPPASRYAATHRGTLQALPVWLFSSGPLDDSASDGALAPVPQVMKIAKDLEAHGHLTFGGKLERGQKMRLSDRLWAQGKHGDFRDQAEVAEFAWQISTALEAMRTRAIELRAALPRQKTVEAEVPQSVS